MPKRKFAAEAALDCVQKKLRSRLPLRRPRSHFHFQFLNHRRSSPSPLLRCDEKLLSVDDDSSRVTDNCPTTKSTTEHYNCKSFSSYGTAVSESYSCVDSSSIVGESMAVKHLGFSTTLHLPDASDFDVTSPEQPNFSVHRISPVASFGLLLKSSEKEDDIDDDGGSIVDGGAGLISPIDIDLDCSSSELESDFSPSMYFDSGTEFSERSAEDPSPTLTYSCLLQYRQAFQKSLSILPSAEHVPHRYDTAGYRLVDDNGEDECYLILRSRERRQVYLLNYTQQSNLLIKQRLQIVHWIIEQSAKKELQKETMFLGVNLLDRFLSNGNFKNKRNLQIAGISCLTLATRIEENQIYNSVHQSTFHMGRNTYSRAEVVAMEWLVQEVLNFKCYLPTVYNFLSFYLKVARADIEMAKNAQHLAELALLEPEQLSFWPSTVAASLVILSSLPNHYSPHIRVMKAHLRSEDDNIDECIKSLSLSFNKF